MVKNKPTQTNEPYKKPVVYINRPRMREAESQTDEDVQEPPLTIIPPPVIVVNASTQLDEGVLFDFDVEVEPILDVLIDRTIREAQQELEEEIYMEELQRKRKIFEQRRDEEIEAIKELESAEFRRKQERDDRIQQERTMLAVAQSALLKAEALKQARGLFGDLCEKTIQSLSSHGFFKSSLLRHIESEYLPAILRDAEQRNSVNALYDELKHRYVPDLISEACAKAINV